MTAFAEEMKNAEADYQLVLYGKAMHGFTHDTATGQQPDVLYDAQTDARSSIAILRARGCRTTWPRAAMPMSTSRSRFRPGPDAMP